MVKVVVVGPPVWGMPRRLSRVVSGVLVVVPCGVAVVEAKNVALPKVWGVLVVCSSVWVSSVWVLSSVRVRAVKPRVRRLLVGESAGSVMSSVSSGVVVSVLSAVGGLVLVSLGSTVLVDVSLVVGSVEVPVPPVVSGLVGV